MDLFAFDRHLGTDWVAGVDEVGRGPLAGPIMAAGVLIDQRRSETLQRALSGLNDSKKLSEKKRNTLFPLIKANVDKFIIISREPAFIDSEGIEEANQRILQEALLALNMPPDCTALVDGRGIRLDNTPAHQSVIKGDSVSAAIACASVLAKVTRDQIMIELDKLYPQYSLAQNKGYPTREHKQAVIEHGLSPAHRESFCSFAITN